LRRLPAFSSCRDILLFFAYFPYKFLYFVVRPLDRVGFMGRP
jgi:hypothetical protein